MEKKNARISSMGVWGVGCGGGVWSVGRVGGGAQFCAMAQSARSGEWFLSKIKQTTCYGPCVRFHSNRRYEHLCTDGVVFEGLEGTSQDPLRSDRGHGQSSAL